MSDNHVQVLLYTSYLHIIGGIETFVASFIEILEPYYDIGLYCPKLSPAMMAKLSRKIPIYQRKDPISCDTLIMIRIMDEIPGNVTYKKSIRMCHATRSSTSWHILEDCDQVVHVSKISKKTFESDGMVIYNPVVKTKKEALLLVSATRIPAPDKGKNTDRMIRLAQMLHDADIPFLWLNFSDGTPRDVPKGFINVGTYHDLQPYISRADYLVQLSDQEGFGYSVAEALINNTAVICTPFETTKELHVADGQNGYIVPFDMDFDVHKLLDVPVFEYTYDNDRIIKQWRKLLGNKKPLHNYNPSELITVRVNTTYSDIVLNQMLHPGDVIQMTRDRAIYLQNMRFVKILDTTY